MTYFTNKYLLTGPIRRAAYSDRTAWLMAEMSRLAYFKFEGSLNLETLAESLIETKEKDKVVKSLKKLLKDRQQSADDAKTELAGYLKNADFKLVETFSESGTQAFLAVSDSRKMIVLAFRGTEKDSRDIKADLETSTIEVGGCKIHSGFYNAFQTVKTKIEQTLKPLTKDDYQLYITGHSLGGALAILGTKFLASDSTGACYTFGGPRVTSANFGYSIRTPIYRIVNAADFVPRVPPAYLPNILIAIFEIVKIPFLSNLIIKIMENIVGYRHLGDMRFLTACNKDFSDLRLLKNPTIIDRFIKLINRLSTNWKAGATDHFILNYTEKMAAYAKSRKQDSNI